MDIMVGATLVGVILVGTTMAEEVEEAILAEVTPEEATTGSQSVLFNTALVQHKHGGHFFVQKSRG